MLCDRPHRHRQRHQQHYHSRHQPRAVCGSVLRCKSHPIYQIPLRLVGGGLVAILSVRLCVLGRGERPLCVSVGGVCV